MRRIRYAWFASLVVLAFAGCGDAASGGGGNGCTQGSFDPIDPSATCGDGDECTSEGHFYCDDVEPFDRLWTCTGGRWKAAGTICDGCPRTAPADGASCSVTRACSYGFPQRTCQCTAGQFHCQPATPDGGADGSP